MEFLGLVMHAKVLGSYNCDLQRVTRKLIALNEEARVKNILRLCIFHSCFAEAYISYGLQCDAESDDFDAACDMAYWLNQPNSTKQLIWDIFCHPKP